MKLKRTAESVACLLAVCLPAASANPPPRGIYCSCPPTSAVSHSVMPVVAAKDFVEGTLLRVAWRDLEPSQGGNSWTLLDDELNRARTHTTKVALAVVNGPSAPTWLPAAGAQMFNFDFQGSPTTMPVPWDPVFLNAWTAFVAALGARYDADPDVTLVHVTHSTANGFEMQLPFWPPNPQNWQAVGYTPQLVADSWITVLNAFAAAFPSKPLDVEVHPVLSSDEVAQAVWEYGHATLPERLGLFAAWWSQNNAYNAYPGMYALIQQAAAATFGNAQLVTNATNNPGGFGPGGITAALDLAITTGVRYVEVWNNDILNPQLESLLRTTAGRLTADPGDLNCDGFVNSLDVSPFVLALLDPAGYQSAYPYCQIALADLTGDGTENGLDVPLFVGCVLNAGCP